MGDLGRRLGVAELAIRPSEPFRLDIEGVGLASLEEGPEGQELLVILAWPLEPWDRATLGKALESCSPAKMPDFPLHVGLSGDKILLMTASPLSALDAPTIENLILRLVKIRQRLAES